ncbi:helix-turn-helix transcriptional regulator [Arthrobacter sp. efr-133-TYG-118]|uniref:helix-turn-helix domain-containing protein n=1 Tax=Arthrobacter sp. efr-133-TYG-118 TaxID=3040279 RepID=UPI00254B8B7D|nr:helix-turn-helix transcriptional regulator [Arthrobacter sp. efr-133-TYG-118]
MNTLQTPEGKLLQDAQRRKGMSARKAAELAGMSDTRWRNIVNGYQAIGQGQSIHIVAPAETLARMARVVGVSGEEFAAAGREDVQAVLTELWPGEQAGWSWSADTGVMAAVPTTGGGPKGERGLRRLIESKRAGRTIASLSDACGGDPTPRRLQQIIADGIDAFPKANTIQGLARGLGVSITEVVMACAVSLGLEVEDATSDALVLAGAGNLPASSRAILQNMAKELIAAQHEAQHHDDPHVA